MKLEALIFVVQAWNDWGGEGKGCSQLYPHICGKLFLALSLLFIHDQICMYIYIHIYDRIYINDHICIYADDQEGKAVSGGRWRWESTPKEIHTDIEFAMNEVLPSYQNIIISTWSQCKIDRRFEGKVARTRESQDVSLWACYELQEYSYSWAGETFTEIATYKPDMSGRLNKSTSSSGLR